MRPQGRAAMVISAALVLSAASQAEAGLRTDGLSGRNLKTWRAILAVVQAVDSAGQPLHPTLLRLYREVESSAHDVRIVITRTKGTSPIAGRFRVESVGADGRHEASILLNLRMIDRVLTGFPEAQVVTFERLSRTERYAQVLGHEIGPCGVDLSRTRACTAGGGGPLSVARAGAPGADGGDGGRGLLGCGAGDWSYYGSMPKPADTTAKSFLKNDVLPGTTKATLTLDDGRQLALDTVQHGLLAEQGVTRISNTNGALVYNGNGNDRLRYNTLTTHKGEQYPLILSDGTRIFADASTTIRFPVAFTGSERVVEINGRAWFEVAKNAKQPFYVVKGDQKIRVMGTHFDVNAYDNEVDMKVTLVEGSVQVMNGKTKGIIETGATSCINQEQ